MNKEMNGCKVTLFVPMDYFMFNRIITLEIIVQYIRVFTRTHAHTYRPWKIQSLAYVR